MVVKPPIFFKKNTTCNFPFNTKYKVPPPAVKGELVNLRLQLHRLFGRLEELDHFRVPWQERPVEVSEDVGAVVQVDAAAGHLQAGDLVGSIVEAY